MDHFQGSQRWSLGRDPNPPWKSPLAMIRRKSAQEGPPGHDLPWDKSARRNHGFHGLRGGPLEGVQIRPGSPLAHDPLEKFTGRPSRARFAAGQDGPSKSWFPRFQCARAMSNINDINNNNNNNNNSNQPASLPLVHHGHQELWLSSSWRHAMWCLYVRGRGSWVWDCPNW